MDSKGNIHLMEKFEDETYKATNVETKEVKFYDNMPSLFKMIPPGDIKEVKEMNIEQRLEYYKELVEKEKSLHKTKGL